MKVILIGIDPSVAHLLRKSAAQRKLPKLAFEPDHGRHAAADWVIVTSTADRIQAIARFGLPPYRVLLAPLSELKNGAPTDPLGTTLARMTVMGAYRPLVSRTGVSLARRVLTWAQPRIEAYVRTERETDQAVAPPAAERPVRAKKRVKNKPPADERVARFTATARRWDGPESSR